jgi:hypothetical protein
MDNTAIRIDVHGRPQVKRRHISFSALNKFVQCPRKFHAYDVAKVIKEPESPAMLEGKRVHQAMAEFIAEGKPLPSQYRRYADWATTMVTRAPGEIVKVEHQMACTFDLTPCAWFSKKERVWLRAMADLLVINDSECLSVDWKTGREPDERWEVLPKNFQLRITALMIFMHFPQVKNIKSRYVYLNEGSATQFDMPRQDLRQFIRQVYDHAALLQQAVRDDHWPPRPSRLCVKHCGVTACQYHGVGN